MIFFDTMQNNDVFECMLGNEGENEQSCSELRDASRIRRNEVIRKISYSFCLFLHFVQKHCEAKMSFQLIYIYFALNNDHLCHFSKII